MKKSSRVSLKISLGTKEPALVDINAFIDVEAGFFIGDDPISPEEADDLLKRAKSKTSRRIIKDADLSSAFGIDMEDLPTPSTPTVKKKPKSGKKTAKKAAKTVVPEVKSKKVPTKKE